MELDPVHLSDEDLLRAADGELTARRAAEVNEHLATCWTCRVRRAAIEKTIADYISCSRQLPPELPPPDGARALLKARLAAMAETDRESPWQRLRMMTRMTPRRRMTLAALAAMAAVVLLIAVGPWNHQESMHYARVIPDPEITPGAVLPVTRDDVCAINYVETARVFPTAVALQVFAAYGIRRPQPHAYEIDYLVSPALGGSDSVRNFWPQSYQETIWNAHIKDALEAYLHQLVCHGELNLKTAQQDISQDWVAAYRKYFHTHDPLPEHAAFLKDRPWDYW